MLAHKSNNSLSPRGSKLLVEVVIGIVGLLGILLAQVGASKQIQNQQQQLINSETTVSMVSNYASPIDWAEILF